VFVLLLCQTTIILATIEVNLGISLKNAPVLDKITPLSKGHPPANPSRASLKMGLRKDRIHKGLNLQRRWDKFFHTEVETIPEGEPVMMGTFPVAKHPALMLFDSDASHTFINRTFVMKHGIPIGETKDHFYIQSLAGRLSSKEKVY